MAPRLGPVIALSWPDKMRSMHRLSVALSQLVQQTTLDPSNLVGGSEDKGAEAPARHPAFAMLAGLAPIAGLLGLALLWAIVRPQNALIAHLAQRADLLRGLAGAHPALALLLFVLAYTLAVSLMLPVALILTFAGGYLLGPAGGAAGAMAGATLGAAISYGMGRLAPTSAVSRWERRLHGLRKLRQAFASHPFRYTLSMRLMPLTPFTVVSLAAGWGRVGLAPFLFGTLMGVAPECVAYSAIGGGLANGFKPSEGLSAHPALWIGLVAAAALVAMTTYLSRKD